MGLVLALPAPSRAQDAFEKERAALLEGVATLPAPGSPGALAVWGKDAFVLVAGENQGARAALVAAARIGSGRLVGFGHDGYLRVGAAKEKDGGALILGAVRWAGGNAGRTQAGPRVAVWSSDLAPWLKEKGLRATAFPGRLADAKLAEFDVLVCGGPGLTEAEVADLARWVRAGGGVVAAQTGWGWKQGARGLSMRENALNQLFAPAGLSWTDGFANPTREGGYAAGVPLPPLVHALAALDRIAKNADALDEGARRQAEVALGLALPLLPDEDPWLQPRIASLLERSKGELVATPEHPIRREATLVRILARLERAQLARAKPIEVRAHPAAAQFPGSVPAGATPVTRKLTLALGVPGWQSTGLYAAPGAQITVDLARELVPKKLGQRIGSHTDELWELDSWPRMPAITQEVALAQPTTQLANPFGGPVYLVVPEGLAAGEAQVLVRGAIEAPLFVRGRTPLEEWKRAIRARPAPWAEIQSAKIALSVPSECVRALDDPEALMAFWDRVADAMADLAGKPHERLRPERFAADVEISAGYMHSGYPIMTHLDAAPWMVDRAHLAQGEWGLYHELGHNHQDGAWTFECAGEVTNNVFVLYVLDKVCGVDPASGHPALAEGARKLEEFVKGGSPWQRWCEDPFLALHMYRQLIEGFGWETYQRVIASYADPAQGPAPADDAQKREQWMTRYSRAAGRDLSGFFRAWGVPVGDAACSALSDLQGWMPADFPPH